MFGNGRALQQLVEDTKHFSKRLNEVEKMVEELDKAVRGMMSYMDARVAFYEKIIEKIVDRPAPEVSAPKSAKREDHEEEEDKSTSSSILTAAQRKRLEEKKKRARSLEKDYKDNLDRSYDNDR